MRLVMIEYVLVIVQVALAITLSLEKSTKP